MAGENLDPAEALSISDDAKAVLLKQLLASFDKRQNDPELDEWEYPPKPRRYSVKDQRGDPTQDPKCPFFLFKMKASAKKAQISWWKKKYSRFPPERAGYTHALRVAHLSDVRGTEEGFRLEQAGPGALSYHMDVRYRSWPPRPKEEVAVIRRLPKGDGISVTSHVYGLGVKVRDVLFVLHCPSVTVALSFTEQSFYVSSKFVEEPLYASAGIDFIDITVALENLIGKLYRFYEEEEQEKKMIVHDKQEQRIRQELIPQLEELALQNEDEAGEEQIN